LGAVGRDRLELPFEALERREIGSDFDYHGAILRARHARRVARIHGTLGRRALTSYSTA
jgi:hypothetical protein